MTSIHSDRQLAQAQEDTNRLLAQGTLDRGEELDLDALGDLVAVYEDLLHPIEPAGNAELLTHLMESQVRILSPPLATDPRFASSRRRGFWLAQREFLRTPDDVISLQRCGHPEDPRRFLNRPG
jgi:hypothetical protein